MNGPIGAPCVGVQGGRPSDGGGHDQARVTSLEVL